MPRKASSRTTIRELTGKTALLAIFPLVKQQNKTLTKKQFLMILDEMLPRGYRCIAAYQGDVIVGICGFWTGHRFWCKKFIDLDNVIVSEAVRSRGIGQQMVRWVEKEARELKCDIMGLDSYTTAYAAHRFYFREGYSILGYHFVKKL